MSSFLQMKKQRAAASGNLAEKLKNSKGGGKSFKDDRFYYPVRDAQGNGFAIIRFLPTAKDNDAEFVKIFSHGFKGSNGKWFIENCPTTLGHDCPVCEANSEVYNRSKDEYEKVAKSRKRKLAFISNVLIVSDKKNPENEGKVMLFKYGATIFDMISSKASPEFEDEKAVDIFSMDEGANFKLKIVQKDGNTNYDKSGWEEPSAVADGEADAQESIWNQQVDLREFIDPKLFKDAAELKKKFDQATGAAGGTSGGPSNAGDVKDGTETPARPARSHKSAESKAEPKAEAKSESVAEDDSETPEDETKSDGGASAAADPVAYFRNLGKKAAGG